MAGPNRAPRARGKAMAQKARAEASAQASLNIHNTDTSSRTMAQDSSDIELNPDLNERFNTRFGTVSSRYDAAAVADSSHARAEGRQRSFNIKEYFEQATQPVEGGPWLSQPELPVADEIVPPLLEDNTPLPNKVQGAYDSKEQYLETQYRLLREDLVRPLREAVALVRDRPYLDEAEYEGGSIGLYEPVYFTTITFSPRGIALRAAFSLGRVKKRIRWDQSKRLITGTVVALSPADDAFKTTCVLATVAARPLSALEQDPPEIDLFFAAEDLDIDPMKKWIMVESRGNFFEAGRHTLLALQHMMREPFPLTEHLVDVVPTVDAPKYLKNNPFKDLSCMVALEDGSAFENVNIITTGVPRNTGLDKSQAAALERILTKKLAIVQGPPGTGKTYVSVAALKVLLANMDEGDPPIIVTCQKNHALDQLLRHIAQFEPRFVRLGGRSKDKDVVKKRTLWEVRAGASTSKGGYSLKFYAIAEMKRLTAEMQKLLAPFEVNRPPLDHTLLEKLGIITPEQARSIETGCAEALGIAPNTPGIQMELWLGTLKTQCHRPIQPDAFGFVAEEDADLDFEELQELEAEAAQEEDDIEALKGPYTAISDNWTARLVALRTEREIKDILQTHRNLHSIPVNVRGAVYRYFQAQVKKEITEALRKLAKKYEFWVLNRRIGMWESDAKILAEQKLVGMTTTGLSKYRGLITSLSPKVILVEEAAETQEPPVTAACVPSLEHLILVGDHKQLRPHCQHRIHEGEPFNFNLSLFERLVNNNIEFDTLVRQRRMIPEVRRLVKPVYGTQLKNHPCVKDISNRPPVEGMGGCNSFFMTHEWPEAQDSNMSFINKTEADMIVGLVNHLVFNGVDISKITVLTFYTGQRKELIRKLRGHPNLRNSGTPFNVVTVDSYQGEENDIVILSLVRSNRKYKIGFLNVDNRVCVALSRARRGLYIFGNGQLVASESKLWGDVIEIMWGKKGEIPPTGPKRRVGYKLPVTCTNHGNTTFLEAPSDWEYLNGGCDIQCHCRLPCGHACMLRCHPFDSSRINCTQRCGKEIGGCGHTCAEMCCDPCRCSKCESRIGQDRSLLKPRPRDTGPSSRGNHLVQMGPQRLSAPSDSAINVLAGSSHLSPEFKAAEKESLYKWRHYAEGGVKEADAELVRKMEEINRQILDEQQAKASGASPSKSTAQETATGPLVDLLPVEAGPASPVSPKPGQTQSSSHGGNPQLSLLD